ncbi:MAG: transposase, partial [Phycisphaerales bacterium]|nr:transposase [Phycisphaerales bacterium]
MPQRFRRRRRSSDDASVAQALTFSTFRRQPFLKRDRACEWLSDAVATARSRHGFELWAFVFMPEHVHLVIYPRSRDFALRRVLSSIKLPVTRRAVRYVRQHRPELLNQMLDEQPNGDKSVRFWQRGGGYDRDLREPGTIHATIDYIHANPVRRGLVDHPVDYPWSSAGFYAGIPGCRLNPDVGLI